MLVDDRFVYQGANRWLDIATGQIVPEPRASAVRSIDEDASEREAVLRCVDRILRAADVRDAAGIRVMRLGCPAIPVCTALAEAARALRSLGFVAVCASADLPAAVRRELLHRHLVLFASEREWGSVREDRVTRWIRDATAASPRAHLLVLVQPRRDVWLASAATRGGASVVRECAAVFEGAPGSIRDWRRQSARAAAMARRLIWRGDLQRAEATLQAIAAEAIVRHEQVTDEVWIRRAELCFWRDRLEEAAEALARARGPHAEVALWRRLLVWADGTGQLSEREAAWQLIAAGRAPREPGRPLERALLSRIGLGCLASTDVARAAEVDRFIGQTGARGILRWGLGRANMNLIHGVSTLLEVVQEADDEYAALRHGCSWAREQARAEGAGFVANDGTRLIAGDGVGSSDLVDPDVRAAVAAGRGHTVADGPHATVTAPVRYGGSTIGFAIVRGRSDSAESLAGAARALASVCAPALRARLDGLALSAASQTLVPEILGRSPAVAALREATARAAAAPFPVLIEGESGTGKELVARAVHRLSPRRDRRFAALNCAALTDDLLEAELFGYTRGAFTGALNPRAGLFEESHGSTLFLDEVTELSPRAQAKLLRVLQEREIRRLGEHLPRPVDVRVVAATNLPLVQAVGAGRFREDLLFRLAVVRVRVPPLRDRVEDVPLLAQAFWRAATADARKHAWLGPDAIGALCTHSWPGNVRELQNIIAALVVTAPTRGRIGARHVDQVLAGSDAATPGVCPTTLGEARQALDRRMIAAALARHGGRCTRAARELGLSRQGLTKAMTRLGLLERQRTCRLRRSSSGLRGSSVSASSTAARAPARSDA